MRRLLPATALALVLLLGSALLAQINGTPPSVTSLGWPSRGMPPGVPPSVTSLGPNGFAPPGAVPPGFSPPSFGFGSGRSFAGFNIGFRPRFDFGVHHHRGGPGFLPFGIPVAVPVYVPYYPVPYPVGVASDEAQQPEEDDTAAPTIFERRPRRARLDDTSALPRESEVRPPDLVQPAPATPAPAEASQPASVLIFKDGHTLEVQNYAILGETLYDLSASHPRKIALADLDLDATVKANDDRGIDFRLPTRIQAN